MMRSILARFTLLSALALLLGACAPGEGQADAFPREAWHTLELIQQGGPFPYGKDGTTFFNREGLLPEQPRGFYREYTVPTPGAQNRGARRIVSGGHPPEIFYYTADHYRSFRRMPATP